MVLNSVARLSSSCLQRQQEQSPLRGSSPHFPWWKKNTRSFTPVASTLVAMAAEREDESQALT